MSSKTGVETAICKQTPLSAILTVTKPQPPNCVKIEKKQIRQQQTLKDRIRIIEIQMERKTSFVDDLIKNAQISGEDLMSTIPMCRSSRILQKYGCLHTGHDHILTMNDRWRY